MALRILLADDSMTAQNMGKKILTDAGFDVVTVSNGAAAVKKLAESSPDIAILDVYMPGYTGLEVCERLKSMPGTARVPVLLSVGKMEPFRPEDGMKVRADGVIIKPFEATDLVTVIDKLAERTYGAEAKSSGVVPPPPPEEPEEEALEAETTAEGLETFTPAATAQPIHQEPGIEHTSIPQAGHVSNDVVDGLMPTVFPDDQAVDPFAAGTAAPPPPPPLVEMQESVDAIEELAPMQESSGVELPVEEAAAALPDAPFEFDDSSIEAPVPLMMEELPAHEGAITDDVDIDADELSLEPEAAASLPETPVSEESEEAVQEAAPVWTPVEAQATGEAVGEDIDLDLEAESQDNNAASELQATDLSSETVVPTPMQQAEPFLSPLGKTSYDELDAVMSRAEEYQSGSGFSPMAGEEIPVGAPIADPAEQEPGLVIEEEPEFVPEEEDIPAEPFVIHQAMNDGPADVASVAAEELVPAYETIPGALGIPEPVEAVDESAEGVVLEEPVQELPAGDDEVLELGGDESASTSHDPLAFYGLAEDSQGDILQNPSETDDEPIFALIEDTEIPPIDEAASAEEPILAEELPVETDILEDEDIVEPAPSPVEEIAAESPAPEAPETSMLEEVAAPAAIGIAAAAVPAMVMAASPEPESEFRIEADDEAVEEIAGPISDEIPEPAPQFAPEPVVEVAEEVAQFAPEPVAEVIAEPTPELPAEVEAESQQTLSTQPEPVAASEPTVSADDVANMMAGRVVDRVVDRLKPILAVMVEEILAEVKKK